MADLTDSDFYIYSEISDLNSSRSGQNPQLAPLLKNLSVSRGEIVAPQSGEDLYAHNFISLNDWRIAASFMNPSNRGSSNNRTNIFSNNFIPTSLNIGYANSLFSSDRFYWTGPSYVESALFNPLIVKNKMPSSFSEDNGAEDSSATLTDGIRSLVRTDSSVVFDSPNVSAPTASANTAPTASDFSTAFGSFRNYAQMLRDGYAIYADFLPTVKEWNTTYNGSSQDAPGPWTPTMNGPYKRIYKSVTLQQTTITATQTSSPTYNDIDFTILNCAYVKSSSGQTILLKNARDFLDFTAYVILYQRVVDASGSATVLAYRYSFSKVQSSIGSIITPQGSSETIFSLDPTALLNKINSSFQFLDPATYASGNEYSLYTESTARVCFLAFLKNPPTP